MDATPAPPRQLTVAQLTTKIRQAVEEQVGFVRVEGEISNWRVSPSGHAYFVLKDASASISGVIFRSALSRLRFECRDGMQVVVEGHVGVYEARGQIQIVAERMTQAGQGLLFQKFTEMKARLEREGLFSPERKKKIPMLPRRLGIVTSTQGAALRDIFNVLRRRFSKMQIVVAPARVQGVDAAPEIVEAIRRLNRHDLVDVMIVGRGGGSIEDLWPFNEEVVARAIAESSIPIISAVGHETDFTIADFVADLRAPTPSAAAEQVVGEYTHLCDRVSALERRLNHLLQSGLDKARLRLDRLTGSYGLRRPLDLVQQSRQRLDDLTIQLSNLMDQRQQRDVQRLATLDARLCALDPKGVLSRGYALVTRTRDGRLVTKPGQIKMYEQISIDLAEESIRATRVPAQDDFLDGAI